MVVEAYKIFAKIDKKAELVYWRSILSNGKQSDNMGQSWFEKVEFCLNKKKYFACRRQAIIYHMKHAILNKQH